MVDQLNSMFAFMTQILTRERANHSSNISIMMRRVDKDLKDTYKTVQDVFAGLTKQLVDLAKEVDGSRKQVKAIQEKYGEAREAAEAQAQYVAELEAVLDGQCAGVTETMRKLTEKAARRQQALAKFTEESRARETALRRECVRLREELRRYKLEEKLLEGDALPPLLPEMPASWTLRSADEAAGGMGGFRASVLEAFREEDEEDEEDDAAAAAGKAGSRGSSARDGRAASKSVDVVGAVLAHSDSDRAVSRAKPCRKPGLPRVRGPPAAKRKRTDKEFTEMKARAERAERRCGRLYDLVSFASCCLGLLRDVFGVLRAKRLLAPPPGGGSGKLPPPAPPEEVLTDIVALFHKHIPTLTCLPEVIRALSKEAEEGPPPMAGILDESLDSR